MTDRMGAPASRANEPRPLRIAHFLLGRCNVESANGIDKTVYHLSVRQAMAGHVVRVVSLTRKPALPIPGVSVMTYAPVLPRPTFLPPRVLDLVVDRSPLNLPRALVDDLLRARPDVVHFHHTQLPQAVRLGRRLRKEGIAYCVTLHGALAGDARRRRRWMKKVLRTLGERRYLNEAAFLHAISPPDADGARAIGLRSPIEIVPNGIDVDALRPRQDVPLANDHRELQGRRVLLFVGRLDPRQKGLDVLLEALALSAGELALVLVGPTFRDGRRALEEQVRRLGLEGRVVFVGPKFGDEKLRYFRGADVFVHPSRWEAGVPFSVLEASALALPAVLGVACDPSRVFAEGGAAIPTAIEPAALAATLDRVAQMSTDRLSAMGRAARVVATEQFDWSAIARGVVEAYEEHCLAH